MTTTTTTAPPTYRPGTLAYLDGFGPFVPCKVTRVSADGSDVWVLITATDRTHTYVKGDVHKTRASVVVPRDRVYTRSGQYRIRPYRWENGGIEARSGVVPSHGDAWCRTDEGTAVALDYSSRGSVWFSVGARDLGSVRRAGKGSWLVSAPIMASIPRSFPTRTAAWRYVMAYVDALT